MINSNRIFDWFNLFMNERVDND